MATIKTWKEERRLESPSLFIFVKYGVDRAKGHFFLFSLWYTNRFSPSVRSLRPTSSWSYPVPAGRRWSAARPHGSVRRGWRSVVARPTVYEERGRVSAVNHGRHGALWPYRRPRGVNLAVLHFSQLKKQITVVKRYLLCP